MSDFLKKCQEIEDKLKKVSEAKSAPAAPVQAPKKTGTVVINAYSQGDEDKARAQALGNMLLKKMQGPTARQPTDQELFGHLVPSEEQLKKAERQWGSGLNDFFREVQKPVEKSQTRDFGRRGPIQESDLTEEEQKIRNIPVDPRLLKD